MPQSLLVVGLPEDSAAAARIALRFPEAPRWAAAGIDKQLATLCAAAAAADMDRTVPRSTASVAVSCSPEPPASVASCPADVVLLLALLQGTTGHCANDVESAAPVLCRCCGVTCDGLECHVGACDHMPETRLVRDRTNVDKIENSMMQQKTVQTCRRPGAGAGSLQIPAGSASRRRCRR